MSHLNQRLRDAFWAHRPILTTNARQANLITTNVVAALRKTPPTGNYLERIPDDVDLSDSVSSAVATFEVGRACGFIDREETLRKAIDIAIERLRGEAA